MILPICEPKQMATNKQRNRTNVPIESTICNRRYYNSDAQYHQNTKQGVIPYLRQSRNFMLEEVKMFHIKKATHKNTNRKRQQNRKKKKKKKSAKDKSLNESMWDRDPQKDKELINKINIFKSRMKRHSVKDTIELL
eukprot:172001_1